MSLDSIIQTDNSQQSTGYGKNQRGDRNQRRQKPYQRQPRQPNSQQPQQQQQQPSASSSSAQQQMNPALLQQQQQQLQALLSMPLSSFPQMLQQLPMLSMQPFPSSQAFPLSLPSLTQPTPTTNPSDSADIDASRLLKVSATSDAKRVAGSISHTSRLGACPTLLATGQASLNQAIKAIAIARNYLMEDRVDLSVQCEFRDEERGAVSMVLTKAPLRKKAGGGGAGGGAGGGGGGGEEKEVEESELRVAQNSEPSMTAGSIAKKIRGGERVSIIGIGAGSVSATVRAITIARRYLEGDNLDVAFKPSFVHLTMEDGQRSGIKFSILAQQV